MAFPSFKLLRHFYECASRSFHPCESGHRISCEANGLGGYAQLLSCDSRGTNFNDKVAADGRWENGDTGAPRRLELLQAKLRPAALLEEIYANSECDVNHLTCLRILCTPPALLQVSCKHAIANGSIRRPGPWVA